MKYPMITFPYKKLIVYNFSITKFILESIPGIDFSDVTFIICRMMVPGGFNVNSICMCKVNRQSFPMPDVYFFSSSI